MCSGYAWPATRRWAARWSCLQDGRVVLPVVGTLMVTGLTVEQIREQVVKGLRKKLVTPRWRSMSPGPRPRRIFVSGAVKASRSRWT